MKTAVGAIVLAAGASRRLGQPKQLLLHGNEALVGRAIRLAKEAGADPVIAVLGAQHDRIRAAVTMNNGIPVINERWEEGIASSIHVGLRAVEGFAPGSMGALILGCDQIRLTSGHLQGLLEAFCARNGGVVAASTYAGVLGTPAVFPRSAFPELLALAGDKGARALLTKPPCPLIALEFPGGEVDIDEPGDLEELDRF
jgi:CTP:molybdopterin cytidylyltransferase MocA